MSDSIGSSEVLFLSRGNSVVSWYRCGMPALHLGCDWAGALGPPNDLQVLASLKRGGLYEVDLTAYKVVVLQQVEGRQWFHTICDLQAKGIKVFYEIDDYIHAVRKMVNHGGKQNFTKEKLKGFELCMSACDGIIVSTPWLANAYKKYGQTHICMNCIEVPRYSELAKPDRETVNIGWAGGEGHQQSVKAWVQPVRNVLLDHKRARFVSMGLNMAAKIDMEGCCMSLPFTAIEQFPAALTNFDVAIAPAGKSNFFAAKSDLRFLECGAIGIPVVADPFVYGGTIDHGVTGFLAERHDDVQEMLSLLVKDEALRNKMGEAAREYVYKNRAIHEGVEQWISVFTS